MEESKVIAAAGEIACASSPPVEDPDHCRYDATAGLLDVGTLAAVLPLGDNQYESGSLADYELYYDPWWGQARSITQPVPGDREYGQNASADPTGYFEYFGEHVMGPDGFGYYSFNLPADCTPDDDVCWHFVALNSELCMTSGGCGPVADGAEPGPGNTMYDWLRHDLAAHDNRKYECTLAYWHHPLFTFSAATSPSPEVQPLWDLLYTARADIVLNADAHNYQRWDPMDRAGLVDRNRGIREFVVGTGGTRKDDLLSGTPPDALANAQDTAFGVLLITMGKAGFTWEWRSAEGQPPFTDTPVHRRELCMTDPRPGDVIAGHRLLSVIGRGGMSVVFLAEHIELRRNVALKVLGAQLAEDDAFRERFIRESRMAAALDHPNIVTVYDAGEADGLLYISMRNVEGTDLERLLRAETRLDPGRAVALVSQAAAALDAAHDAGLVHRDVKPGNILLTTDPVTSVDHAFLSDFGVTKRIETGAGLTRSGQFVGTVDYVAPEQIQDRDVDGRADVYSLGCVLYRCLVGEVPFPRETEIATIYAQVQDPPPVPSERRPELPGGFDAPIARALAKSREDRFETCTAFADAAGEVVRPRRPSPAAVVAPVAEPRPTTSRRRVGLVVAGLAVAAAVSVAAVMALGSDGDDADPSGTPSPSPSVSRTGAGARVDARRRTSRVRRTRGSSDRRRLRHGRHDRRRGA